MYGYLKTQNKVQCFGCEACVQVCPVQAIKMREDEEGFCYPIIDEKLCIGCDLCSSVCPYENKPNKNKTEKYVFGGYHKDINVRNRSTSGGAFTAIVDAWCDDNYVVFGAASKGLKVYHTYVTNKKDIGIFCKSKYSQSNIGDSYRLVRKFLRQGKKVIFSGTPCQNAGLLSYMKDTSLDNLLTIEVICEGVPSPLFVRKYEEWMFEKHGARIEVLDYRYKDCRLLESPVSGKWDFQVMYTLLQNSKSFKLDRWFNPFWSIWLKHLMSRPSCYECPFAESDRVADITLGDLWGVHIYCPELYGRNTGASLVVCNTKKGQMAINSAKVFLVGHDLDFKEALKYQGPMRKHISYNQQRDEFMKDLKNKKVNYEQLCDKWNERPNLKLLWQKYVWGNRQKVFLWNVLKKFHLR